jgi:O-antigen/teichoic acid export membrane protein
MSVKNKIVKGMAANSFGQAITLGSQLLLIPLMLSTWGADLFGVWLVISAVPAYLSFANFGVSPYTATILTGYVAGEGRYGDEYFIDVYRGAFFLTGLSVGLLSILTLLLVQFSLDIVHLLDNHIEPDELTVVLILFGMYVSCNFFMAMWDVAFRPAGRYAGGVIFQNLARLLEIGGVIVLLLVKVSPRILDVVAIMVLLRILSLILVFSYIKQVLGLGVVFRKSKNIGVKTYLNRALGYMLMPLGYAFSIQGMIIVAAMVSPAYAAAFGVTRTLISSVRQFILVISQSFWPELTVANSEGEARNFRRLFFFMLLASVSLTVVALMIIFLLSEEIFTIWLGSTELLNRSLFMLLAVLTFISIVWNQFYILLASVANVTMFSVLFLLGNVMSFCISLLAPSKMLEIYTVVELLILVVSFLMARKDLWGDKCI